MDNLNQLKQIIGLKFDRILFDNMSPQILRKGTKLSKKLYETEASGGVTLKNVKKIAATGVDRISVGAITHSAVAIDLKIRNLINNRFYFFNCAWAAANLATGTLYGEQET